MSYIIWGMNKLMHALDLGCSHCRMSGSSLEFEAERQKWLETSTRDSILADLTRFILQGSEVRAPVFKPAEAASLESILAKHADRSNCWDQNSLESCLLAHVPNDEKCQALLTSCMPSLWKLVTFFAQWPFVNTAPSAGVDSTFTSRLPFDALVRAIAFLCGRHSIMFSHYNDERDSGHTRRTDRLALEHIFRALAIDADQDAASNTPSGWIPKSSHSTRDDVFDTVNTVQPRLNEFTSPMCRDELSPLVTRLLPAPSEESAPRAALSSLTIPTTGPGGILELLDLFVLLLRHADKFDPTPTPGVLAKELEAARTELQDADRIAFGAFYKCLGDDIDLNVYDALALLFNMLLYPTSLTDGVAIDGDKLLVYALRRPGCKVVSD